ncbi:squalene-hopene cyclase [Streptomyces griseoflavus]|uniref:squalene--hopene cyclase n=1 Tax=Streptomyces rimosus TaxID=1927 RepID=UPI0006C1972B|nr:squalene--hopene cyclase [Streptomyces rimosus]KOG64403.1 squalene-hopene cyclase [Streptomyces griseoflavus]
MTTTAGDGTEEKSAPSAAEAGVTFPHPPSDETEEAAQRAVRRATDHLLARQHAEGYWKGFTQSDMAYDAQDLLLRQFLGILDERVARAAGRWMRSRQSADGSWPLAPGSPGDLATTVQVYAALRLAGDAPDEEHMLRCAAWVREQGGVRASRLTARLWCAMFGWYSWDDLPEMPPEIIALPRWAPMNIYSFNSWIRLVLVPLSVIGAHRPVRPAPFTLDELFTPPGTPAPGPPAGGWDSVFRRVNDALRAYRKVCPRPVRRAAMHACTRWLLTRQEADGSWGGFTPMTAFAVLALHVHGGYPPDHPVLKAALGFLDRCTVWPQDRVRKLESVPSPVWDTSLTLTALTDAGLPADHPALVKAADWLLTRQTVRPGDWAVRRPRLAPGGWSFEFRNETYPDLDDTSAVVLALGRVTHPEPARVEDATGRAVRWSLGMQSRNGGWAAFDADNTSALPGKSPFFDIGDYCVDPPTADITAHVLEMLAARGLHRGLRARRAVRWLLGQQEEHGAWSGRWGTNYVYGTGCVLPALAAVGIPGDHPAVRRAADWLVAVQNTDGGWGEDWRSYTDPAYAGRGPSTPSQTAWALLGLLAAGERDGAAVGAGIRWLTERQTQPGSWEESQFTGTGVPLTQALNYEYYRHVFPLMALGRYVRRGQPGTGGKDCAAESVSDCAGSGTAADR